MTMQDSDQITNDVLCKLDVSEMISEDSLVLQLSVPHSESLNKLIPNLATANEHPLLMLTVSFDAKPTAGYEVYINNHHYGGKKPKNEKPQGFMTFYEVAPNLLEMEERAKQAFYFPLKDFVDFEVYDGNLTMIIRQFAGKFEGLRIEDVALVRKH